MSTLPRRRLVGELLALKSAAGVRGGRLTSWVETATITTVSAGAAADGNALVTISWRGQSLNASYLSTYTPTVGHVVAVVIQPPSLPLILSRVIGTPP